MQKESNKDCKKKLGPNWEPHWRVNCAISSPDQQSLILCKFYGAIAGNLAIATEVPKRGPSRLHYESAAALNTSMIMLLDMMQPQAKRFEANRVIKRWVST